MNIFNRQKQWKEKFHFTDTFYLPFGCNTYEIKDKLKGAGCHFWRGLGWYCADDNDVYESVLAILPEGAELVPFNFSDCFEWNEVSVYILKDEVEENIKRMRKQYKKAKVVDSKSSYIGVEGERIRNIPVTIKTIRGFDSDYGYKYIYTFEYGDDILVWFSSVRKDVQEGQQVVFSGTIKKLEEYNGVKQNVMTRCLLKEIK